MTHTGLVFLLVTVVTGGMAVDVMRHEGSRARVQQVLDECTLNAAIVEQPGTDATSMGTAIQTCLSRMGTAPVGTVTATANTGYRQVSSSVSGRQTNQFMNMVDVDTLTFGAASSAAVPSSAPVEVMLTYEASNSSSTYATTMKSGMKEFVDALMANDTTGQTTLGVLPFTSGVNLTSTLAARYTITNVSNVTNSTCIEFPASDFGAIPIGRTTAYSTMTMVDFASSTTTTTSYVLPTSVNATVGTTSVPCPPYTGNVLRLPSADRAAIKTTIDAGQYFGGARWDHAMNWATALLDPSSNGAIGPLLPTAYAQRPLAYGTANAQKVIVLISNFGTGDTVATGDAWQIASGYATGPSPIWRSADTTSTYYSIYHANAPGTNRYYSPHNNAWSAFPFASTSNLVGNGGFEGSQPANTVTYASSLSSWNTGSRYAVWGNGYQGVTAIDGSNFLEMDSSASVDNIFQNVSTASGVSYTITLQARQRPTPATSDSLQILWNNVVIGTITPGSSWQSYSFNVTGTGSSVRLELRELSGENNSLGVLVDNLSVTSATLAARQLTWPEVWKSVRATWVAWQLYARPFATTAVNMQPYYNAAMAAFRTNLPYATQQSQFLAECTATKAQGVVIYVVGLNPVERTKGALASCASSAAFYFETTAADFSATMKAIALSILQQGYAL